MAETNRTTWVIVIVMLLVAVALAVVLAGLARNERFSDEVRDNFLDGCMRGLDGDKGACECLLFALEDRMSEEELIELEMQGEQAALDDPRVEEAAESCFL